MAEIIALKVETEGVGKMLGYLDTPPAANKQHLGDVLFNLPNKERNWYIDTGDLVEDDHVTFINFGGSDIQNSKLAIDDFNISVEIRETDHKLGYNRAIEIKKILQGINSFTDEGINVIGIWLMSQLEFTGRDKNNRCLFMMIFRVMSNPADKGQRLDYYNG